MRDINKELTHNDTMPDYPRPIIDANGDVDVVRKEELLREILADEELFEALRLLIEPRTNIFFY